MKPKQLLILLFQISLALAQAQLSETQSQKIDSLFQSWTEANHPGGTIGIMQNGEVIYSRAFGMASLEYEVPNTTETIFNTGSVSKQFTAMGIVLLHERGLLSVDDDIRKHLPDLPDFGHPITIRHMLHHTSGMRSLHAMLGLAGWRGDDSRTNEDLYRFMLNQKELNFTPGAEYLYCNTGYILMATIIEKVTSEKFPDWMIANVFEPLGMPNTYVEDRYDRVVPNNATSYYNRQGNFFRAVEYWGYVGSGNMHSTTTDLLTWLQNFSTPKENWRSAFELLKTTDTLNDGSENNYAFGVLLDEFNGHKRIQHGGSIGGFRAYAGTYPSEQLSIAVLTNYSSANPGQKANQIASILLQNKELEKEAGKETEAELSFIEMSSEQLQTFEGSYWNDKENYARKIYVKNDTLRYYRSANSENPLMPVAENEFRMLGIEAILIAKFDKDEKGQKRMSVSVDNEPPSIFEHFEPMSDPKPYMQEVSGRYYSPELESIFDIRIKEDSLIGHHARHGDFPMRVLKNDVLEISGYGIIRVNRETDNEITGIRISNGRARNVWFERQN